MYNSYDVLVWMFNVEEISRVLLAVQYFETLFVKYPYEYTRRCSLQYI